MKKSKNKKKWKLIYLIDLKNKTYNLKDFQEKSKDYDYDDGTYESEVSDAEDFY